MGLGPLAEEVQRTLPEEFRGDEICAKFKQYADEQLGQSLIKAEYAQRLDCSKAENAEGCVSVSASVARESVQLRASHDAIIAAYKKICEGK